MLIFLKVSTSFVLLNDTRLMVLPWVRVDNDAVVTLPDDSNLTDPETYEHFRDLIQYRKPPTLDKAVLKIRETALRAFLKENFFDNDLIDDTIVISVIIFVSNFRTFRHILMRPLFN